MDPIDFSEDKKVQEEHFREAVKKHGDSIKAVNWGSDMSQQSRFDALLTGIPWQATYSVLDIGCGRGDLYAYAAGLLDNLIYTGVDLCAEMIALAQSKYMGVNFKVLDILKESPGIHDYVLAAGIFSLQSPNWGPYVVEMMKKMYELCSVYCAATFLSSLTPFEKHENSYHADPGIMFDVLAREVSSKAVLVHSYRMNDFTIKIYK
jgi:SAM-dependent methyltransferase